jgi:hypothetical protein
MERVLDFIRKLNAATIPGWEEVPSEKKTELSNTTSLFTAAQMWSVADPEDREEFVNDDMTARAFARSISQRVNVLSGLVREHIADHLKKKGGGDLMELIHFHSKGNDEAVSLDALSDPNSCGSSVGETLKADKIHHNMFRDKSELNQQTFSRFTFPQDDDIFGALKLEKARVDRLKKIVEDLKSIRSFLSCRSSCDESLTQAVFKVFLTSLLEGINGDDDPNEKYSAQLVSGMKTVRVKAVVSEKYMKQMSKKRSRNYTGGSKTVQLAIESDLVVWKGGPPDVGSKAENQQKMFLHCNVNVEMKKFELMKGVKNRTPLTQVAAESFARRKSLETIPPKLYSILTDISGLYVLWHEVNNDAADVYWVSQQETDPERFVAIIYWLCLCSMGKSTAAFNPRWKQETHTAKQGEGEEEQDSTHGSELASIDEAGPTNDDFQSKQTGAEEEECEDMVGVSFDDSDEEKEAEQWETFYAIENHRILGTSLPLTADFLELHTNRYR